MRFKVTSRKLQILRFVLIVMSSPCFLNSRVMSFLVRSDCGPLVFRKIIKKHNRKILETNTNTTISTEKNCNCRKKKDCPLKNNCLTSSVIYNANVTTESDAAGMNYIGLTEGTFKQRYTQHKLSFRNRNYSNSTELSKHIWTLKDSNINYKIDWSILATAPAYSNKRKRCHLCLTEKLYLIKAKKPTLLNKRTELISKCRHENKFYLANFELNCQQ